jgi:hypothetical protein
MMRWRMSLIVLSSLAIWLQPVCGQEAEEETKDEIENASPDGRFAFRYTGNKEEEEKQTYDLIDKATGKKLMSVAESNEEIGPSARFSMTVLWRADSKAFALTAFLWKRGSSLFVFRWEDGRFRQISVPELKVEVPKKEKGGKDFSHVSGLDSQSAKEWLKDGSLRAEIETVLDGEGGTITATRTVVLGIERSKKAKILQSKIEFKIEKDE